MKSEIALKIALFAFYKIRHTLPTSEVYAFLLPIYNGVHDFSLFCGCFSEIDTSGFDTFMSHKISQESNIIATLQETFCKTMPEGVRIHDRRVDAVFCRKLFQLS